jgi:hypothetical protein
MLQVSANCRPELTAPAEDVISWWLFSGTALWLVVWSGGGELRKFSGEPAAVSHCVHDECHMTPSITEPETAQSQAAVWQCKVWHELVWYCLCSVHCITIVYTTAAGWMINVVWNRLNKVSLYTLHGAQQVHTRSNNNLEPNGKSIYHLF